MKSCFQRGWEYANEMSGSLWAQQQRDVRVPCALASAVCAFFPVRFSKLGKAEGLKENMPMLADSQVSPSQGITLQTGADGNGRYVWGEKCHSVVCAVHGKLQGAGEGKRYGQEERRFQLGFETMGKGKAVSDG